MDINGTSNGETLTGTSSADQLWGRDGSDLLSGGGGDDLLDGGVGNDTLEGGAGFDAVRYSDDSTGQGNKTPTGQGVSVSLLTGLASDNWGDTDVLTGVELVYGSRYDDLLVGGNPANGSAETDGFEGFRGEAGNDIINGGAGYDRASYSTSPIGVIVRLGGTSTGTAQDGFGTTDTLIDIQEAQGSAFADTLYGSDSGTFEYFEGRQGNDLIDGKGGTDRVAYNNDQAAVQVNLATGIAKDGWGGTDTLLNIENIRGSSFNDELIGNDGDNLFEGNPGNDQIFGGDGMDMLRGGTGNDLLDGGANTRRDLAQGTQTSVWDIGDYSTAGSAVVANLTLGTASSTTEGNDTLVSIEGLYGSRFADTLVGDANSNFLRGGGGNDTLDGGDGVDVVDFRGLTGVSASQGAVLTLMAGAGIATVFYDSGSTDTVTVSNFESIIGSTGSDTLVGDAGTNTIVGTGGNDMLDGGDGADTLDYFLGTVGLTVTLGEAGVATFVVGATGQDTLRNFENLRGTSFDDVLTGNSEDNTLRGQAGSDVLDGREGIDTAIYGEAFANFSVVSEGAVTSVSRVGGSEVDTLKNMEFIQFSDLTLTLIIGTEDPDDLAGDAGNNAIFGLGGDDDLDAADGDDYIDGGAGADHMVGGTGNDIYVVDNAGDVVVEGEGAAAVSDSPRAPLDIGGAIDKVIASIDYTLGSFVENLDLAFGAGALDGKGNELANTLSGNEEDNVLMGLAGNDVLQGRGGSNTLNGGTGIDTAVIAGLRGEHTVRTDRVEKPNAQGIDHLDSIERLRFDDRSVALDLDAAAGQTALLLGVAAKPLLGNQAIVGVVLSFFDAGLTMQQLCDALVGNGIMAALAGGADNLSFVQHVFRNLVGQEASAETAAALAGLIDGGAVTQGQLLAVAARLDLNAVNVNLVGLAETGLDFQTL